MADSDLLALFSSIGALVSQRFLLGRQCLSSWSLVLDYLKSAMGFRDGADTWRKWEDGAGPSGPVATLMSILRLACNSERPSPDMLRGAAMACQRYGIDFRGGVPAENIFREMIREEVRRRLAE